MTSHRRAWTDFDRATVLCRKINRRLYRRLLLRSATAGNPDAMRELASAHSQHGEGVRRSIRRRNHWLRCLTLSARNGNALAARLIGAHHLSSTPPWSIYSARRNLDRAKHWLTLAARCGDWEALRLVDQALDWAGPMDADYRRGLVHSDRRYGLMLLKRAARSGHCDAIMTLIDAYRRGTDGARKNRRLRDYWKRRLRGAAARGNPQAQFEIGFMHQIRTRNFKLAVYWLSKAAENGHPEAAMKMASHAKEFGLSEAEEYRWFQRALELRDVDALAVYSRQFWRNGRPTPPQIELWKEMARKGHSDVADDLDRLHRRQHTDRKPSRVRL